MKRIKVVAAIFSMLVMFSAAAHAQVSAGKAPAKTEKQTQKMDEAFERLKSTLSKGGNEGVARAGDGVFTSLADFGRPAGEDTSVVRSEPPTRSKSKVTLANYKAPDCWEVCVSWGPLHVCYTWETRCR